MNYNKLHEPLLCIVIALAAFALALWLTGCDHAKTRPYNCDETLDETEFLLDQCELNCGTVGSVVIEGSLTSVNGFQSDGVCYLLTHYMGTAEDTDDVLGYIDEHIPADAVFSVCGIEVE